MHCSCSNMRDGYRFRHVNEPLPTNMIRRFTNAVRLLRRKIRQKRGWLRQGLENSVRDAVVRRRRGLSERAPPSTSASPSRRGPCPRCRVAATPPSRSSNWRTSGGQARPICAGASNSRAGTRSRRHPGRGSEPAIGASEGRAAAGGGWAAARVAQAMAIALLSEARSATAEPSKAKGSGTKANAAALTGRAVGGATKKLRSSNPK